MSTIFRVLKIVLLVLLTLLVAIVVVRTGSLLVFFGILGWISADLGGTIDASPIVTGLLALAFAIPLFLGICDFFALPWKFWNSQVREDVAARRRRGGLVLLGTGVAYALLTLLVTSSWNFDSSGKPLVYIRVLPDGTREITRLAFDHTYGRPNEPVSPGVLIQMERDKAPAPTRVDASIDTRFFDINGRAIVFYERGPSGEYWLYGTPGHSPTFGEPLQPITKEIVADILRNLQEGRRIYHLGDGLKELKQTLEPFARSK